MYKLFRKVASVVSTSHPINTTSTLLASLRCWDRWIDLPQEQEQISKPNKLKSGKSKKQWCRICLLITQHLGLCENVDLN